MRHAAVDVDRDLRRSLESADFERINRSYWDQGEAVFLERFLPASLVEPLLSDASEARPLVTRAHVPGHKKAGAVSFHALLRMAPSIVALYRSPALLEFISRLVKTPVMRCPEEDLHSCALYVYTEPGDHIGWHYDTSYYQGARYTVLVGLIERSEECRLVARLHTDDANRMPQDLCLPMDPGSMVIFNSNTLWHAVTPLEEGAERVMLTMQFVTTQTMTPFGRLRSNLKDAFVYFGPSALVRRRPPDH